MNDLYRHAIKKKKNEWSIWMLYETIKDKMLMGYYNRNYIGIDYRYLKDSIRTLFQA